MPQGAMLRDQVRAAILATAARALAERGDEVTLADVASAAGVARSTLYRYFPNRDALLHALTEAGAGEVSTLLGDAELDRLPATEALARVTRGLIATGAKYVALTRLRPKTDDAAEAEIAGLLVKLFRRGALEGAFRNDLPPEQLAASYGDLIDGTITRGGVAGASVENASAAVLDIFLSGARRQANQRPNRR